MVPEKKRPALMDSSMLNFTLYVFAYNESGSIEAVVQELHSQLDALGRLYEMIIIDDGSTDGTGDIADRLSREFNNITVIHHSKNLGLGSAYKTAFANGSYDLLTFFSADGQFSPGAIQDFLPLMDDMDIVLGYLPQRSDSFLGRLFSSIDKKLSEILFGYVPKFQGILMFRRKLLSEIKLVSGGGKAWTVLKELIIKAHRDGYRIKSIPIKISKRITGKSKVNNLPTVWANFKQMLLLYFSLRRSNRGKAI